MIYSLYFIFFILNTGDISQEQTYYIIHISIIVGAAEAQKESAQKKRRRILTGFSASTACSSISTRSVQLLYKNVRIICNQAVHLFPNYPG